MAVFIEPSRSFSSRTQLERPTVGGCGKEDGTGLMNSNHGSNIPVFSTLVALLLLGCESRDEWLQDLEPPTQPERIELPRSVTASHLPNLILISIDTLRADRLAAYGHTRPTSPSFDRLSKQSTLFEQAFSQSPKTAPSHMTVMTGVYPEAHRVQNRRVKQKRWSGRLSADLPTLAEMLSAAGYRTFARTGGANMEAGLGFDRGFDSFESPLIAVDALFKVMLKEIERLSRAPEPFFVFVHTYGPHSPYLPPKRYRDQFVDSAYSGGIIADVTEWVDEFHPKEIHREFWRRVDRESPADRRYLLDLYDASIRYTDDQLGVLLDGIEELDISDRTLLVVLSDHGEEFGEHEGFEHDALWQELLHVPLLIRVPGRLRPGWEGRRIAAPVGLIDVLPTLLELIGIPVPAHIQGRSLVGLVESGAAGRSWTFAQNRETGDVALRVGKWKLLHDRGGEHLFDLLADPDERRDSAALEVSVREIATTQIERVLEASRAFWSLARDGEPSELDGDARERLEALGYVE